MSLVVALIAAWAVMGLVPDTLVARLFCRLLVEAPARALNRITRGHLISWLALAAFAALVIWQLEGDGVRLLSLMAPEIVSWLTMFEISILVDVAVAVFASAWVTRARGLGSYVAARLLRSRPRAGRARRTPASPPQAGNDDEDLGRSLAA